MPPKTPPAKAANNGRPPTDRSPDPAAAITNNYMKLPNDVVDDLMRSSSPIQFKVLMVALRQTIGYNRNVARIPVRKVEEIANIRRGAALEALRFWQGAGLITRTDARESGRSAVYSLNLIELQDGEVGANAQLLNSDNRFGRPVCQAYRFDRETALGKASKSPRGQRSTETTATGSLSQPPPVRSADRKRSAQRTTLKTKDNIEKQVVKTKEAHAPKKPARACFDHQSNSTDQVDTWQRLDSFLERARQVHLDLRRSRPIFGLPARDHLRRFLQSNPDLKIDQFEEIYRSMFDLFPVDRQRSLMNFCTYFSELVSKQRADNKIM